MARLNWQKLAHQQQHDRNRRAANRHQVEKKLDGIWMIGKHYGQRMNEIPLQYLIWASENLGENNYHKLKADTELVKRYNQLTHKVGGPVRNTAVKKLDDKKSRHATR